MSVWSSLRPLASRSSNIFSLKRFMSDDHHRIFPLQPSRFQWQQFKNYVHLYVMLGVIPLTLLTTYCNIFIGPATLSEIPEDYVPKHWEYHRHPVTRFFARYFAANPQEDYEKYMHYIFEETEKQQMRKLEKQIKAKMEERHDYQAYYYRPIMAKYHRATRELTEEDREMRGGSSGPHL